MSNGPKKPSNLEEFKTEVEEYISSQGAVLLSELSKYMEAKKLVYGRATSYLLHEKISLQNTDNVLCLPTGNRANPVVKELLRLGREDPRFKGDLTYKVISGYVIFYDSNISQEKILTDTTLLDKIEADLRLSKVRKEMGNCLEDVVFEFFSDLGACPVHNFTTPEIAEANLGDIDVYIPKKRILIRKEPMDHKLSGLGLQRELKAPINVECKNQFYCARDQDYRRFTLRAEIVKSNSILSIITLTDLNIVKSALIGLCGALGIGAVSLTPIPLGLLHGYDNKTDKFIPYRILAGQLYYSEDFYNKNGKSLEILQKHQRALIGNSGKKQLLEFLGEFIEVK